MSQPLITVIIPTFNRAHTLRRSITSVINQTYVDWELLIIDDRSTDNAQSLVEQYRAKDSRITYRQSEYPKGPGGARNFGMDKAKGKYIAFLDSDDEWLPNHLEECIDVLEAEEVKIACGLWYENKNNVTIPFYPWERSLKVAVKELMPVQKNNYYVFNGSFCQYVAVRGFFFLKTSVLVFDRSLLEVAGNFDPGLKTNQDVDLFFRITMYSGVAIVNSIHGICYEGDDNLYFFKDAGRINDKGVVSKLNFHRRYYIKCYKKRARIVKGNKLFVHKHLVLHTTYEVLFYTYDFLSKINKPFNRMMSFFYKLSLLSD